MNDAPPVPVTNCPNCITLQAKTEGQIKRLCDLVLALQEENRQLRATIGDLEARLGLDSSNSSKPPSSDPPWKRPPPKPASGRAPGGQPGHPGHHRELLPPDQVDHFVPQVPERCEQCHAPLAQERQPDDPEPRRHQVAELPPRLVRVIEYQAHGRCCPQCGHLTWATLPPHLEGHTLGPRLTSLLGNLTVAGHMSRRGVEEFCDDVLQVPVSLGSIAHHEEELAAALSAAHLEAQQAVQAAPVKHADETGWKKAGRLHWVWLAATALVAFFRIDPRRNRSGLLALLGEKNAGTLVSDRLHAYLQWTKERWQICWAHLLRDFQALVDRGGENADVGQAGLAAGKELFGLWHQFRAGTLTRLELQAGLEPVKTKLRETLAKARDGPRCKAQGLARRLLVSFDSLWTFAYHEGVEPTNNHAERLLRKPVIWRRISFGSHSDGGCRFAERMLTVVQTLRLQKRNVLKYLEQAVRAHRSHSPCPKLLAV